MRFWENLTQPQKIAAAAGAAAVVALVGLAAVQARPSTGRSESTQRAGLSVALVTPPDLEPVPGGVMEVGALVDGYEHRPPPPMEPVLDSAYVETDPEWPAPSEADYGPPYVSAPTERVPFRVKETTSSTGNQFGFDEPQPDYAAERRARRERLDRAEAGVRDEPRVMRSDSYFQ